MPEFWFRVLLAHPSTGEQISDLDQGALCHLTKLEVVDLKEEEAREDGAAAAAGAAAVTMPDYRVNFYFSPNAYFSNALLWKEFRFRDNEAIVSSAEIEWKDKPEAAALRATLVPVLLAQEPVPRGVQPSFLSVFHPEDRDLELGEVLKGEVWRDPVGVYMSAEFEEEGGEEGGKEGGEA